MALSTFRSLWRKNNDTPARDARNDRTTVDHKMSAEAIVSACGEYKADFLARPLMAISPTKAELDWSLKQAQSVRDRCRAAFPDQPEAARQMADEFVMGVFNSDNLGEAISGLLTEATAAAAGEEVDHHPPGESEQGKKSEGNLNPTDIYKRMNQEKP